jgi:hypothetical protein
MLNPERGIQIIVSNMPSWNSAVGQLLSVKQKCKAKICMGIYLKGYIKIYHD